MPLECSGKSVKEEFWAKA